MTAEAILNPLVRRGLFSDVEHVARSLVRDYVLHQIDLCRKEITEHEDKHGMSFEQFTRYTEKRTEQLRQAGDWSKTERSAREARRPSCRTSKIGWSGKQPKRSCAVKGLAIRNRALRANPKGRFAEP